MKTISLHTMYKIGSTVRTMNTALHIGDAVYLVDRFVIPISEELGVSPLVEADEHGRGILVRLDRWVALRLTPAVNLPVWMPTEEAAATMARAFGADPSISWDAPEAELIAWCDAHEAARTA